MKGTDANGAKRGKAASPAGVFSLSRDGKYLYQGPKEQDVLVIPETVEEIGPSALSECGAREIILPKGLRWIHSQAFLGSDNLRCITLPEGLQGIGDYAFAFTGLTELVIPRSVEYIEMGFLTGCFIHKLVILGDPRLAVRSGCTLFPADAEIMADALEFKEYPAPFGPIHGLRNFAKRWMAGEEVPSAAAVRFRSYLKKHYQALWKEPLLLQLAIEMRVIPAEKIDGALAAAAECGDPTITAALLSYQNDVIPKKVLERVRRERRGRQGIGDTM